MPHPPFQPNETKLIDVAALQTQNRLPPDAQWAAVILSAPVLPDAQLQKNGRVTGAVKNFRFNQSLIEILKNVELMSPSVRATGEESFEMLVPAMKVRDFHFSEATKF